MMSAWIKQSLGVAAKDANSEVKTRYALNALGMFVVTTIAIMLFATAGETLSTGTLAGVLWIVIFFSAMAGLGRSFVSEEERGTAMFLRLLAPSGAVFSGKLLFNILLLLALNAGVTVLFLLVMNVAVKTVSLFLLTLVAGSLGLASASTVVAAIIARARAKNALYPVLAFPLLVPLVVLVVDATRMSFDGLPLIGEGGRDVIIIAAYTAAVIGVSSILFDVIWKE
ncbi:MAG TPA: heme exporter protein CcmB [Candidatus Kapabacteria bacterium]|nr:heme exporter protein CcmB [Candidatus Kapabacteria bacterium]